MRHCVPRFVWSTTASAPSHLRGSPLPVSRSLTYRRFQKQTVSRQPADAIEAHSHARADLAAGPAFFLPRLIHLSDRLHYLAFTMHHIVCDGWSNGILIRDFTDFYAAFLTAKSLRLCRSYPSSSPTSPYGSQTWLESDAAQAALAYWRTHIHRGLAAVDLPTDRPRLPQKSYPGHIESTLLPAALTARLKAYCRAHNATMHQVMLAAFEALIARYPQTRASSCSDRRSPQPHSARHGKRGGPLRQPPGNSCRRQRRPHLPAYSTTPSCQRVEHRFVCPPGSTPFSRLMEEFSARPAGATSQFPAGLLRLSKAFMQPQ